MKHLVVLLIMIFYRKSCTLQIVCLLEAEITYQPAGLSINEQKSIYHAVFSSHLNYASQIWGLSDTKYTDKIFKIQKNAVRIITRAGFNAHTSTIFKSLLILKVHDQITLFTVSLLMSFEMVNYQNLLKILFQN